MPNEVMWNLGPDPALPDWRAGEIDDNGNRFWMFDYHGQFIKYVEYKPDWFPGLTAGQSPFEIAKIHPSKLMADGVICSPRGFFAIDKLIYPELPPPGYLESTSKPNQLYGRQIQATPAPKAQLHR